jgi:hypothetical protein
MRRQNSFSGYIARNAGFERQRAASIEPQTNSAMARAIINSQDDKDWLLYLKGETDQIPTLSWMEPVNYHQFSAAQFSNISVDEALSNADPEELVIYEGLTGSYSSHMPVI